MEIILLLLALGILLGTLAFVIINRRGTDVLEPGTPPPIADLAEELERPPIAEVEDGDVGAPVDIVIEKPTFRNRLSRARGAISGYMGSVLSRSGITQETWDELEEALIRADVGVQPTTELLDQVKATRSPSRGSPSPIELLEVLKAELKGRLAGADRSLSLDAATAPNVWLFVGVNGVGKTTTIGKIGEAADRRRATRS